MFVGLLAMATLILTAVCHKRIFSPIPWDYTRWAVCVWGGSGPRCWAGGGGGGVLGGCLPHETALCDWSWRSAGACWRQQAC